DLLPEKPVDDDASLRREERRRIAAQDAAARSRAEVLALTTELQRERATNTAVKAELDRARAEVDEVRARLRQAQHAEHATAQSLVKAEGELLELRSAEPAAVTAQPPPAPVVDVSAVRALVGDAVAASEDAVRALTEALGELAAAPTAGVDEATVPAPRRRARRRAVRLPGGVLAKTVEAAEFLLRIKGAAILIDGYNVAKLGWPSLELDRQRDQCIAAAENIAKRWNIAMTIVFDGASVEGAHSTTRRKVRIVYSPKGVTADDVLRAEVAATDTDKPVVVVTNDRAIITDVQAEGANTVSSDDFLTLVRR
ncbi:MAG TPA: NYN domain-containing protein, partial [Ilumatobacteraceae bacterium]